jgi:glycerate 2-kinase
MAMMVSTMAESHRSRGRGKPTPVVTGEGRLDATTLAGKVVSEVARHTHDAGVPVHAVVGEDATTPADRRALRLASIREASTAAELADAAAELGRELGGG